MGSRSRISLDGQWNFLTKVDGDSALIAVPSPWQADERFRDHVGTAWYERDFNISEEWLNQNRVVILGFGAVDYRATAWLNEIRLGEHEGGYLPFEFDITRAARAGKNTLTVRVDDPLEIFAEIPHGKQSWYGMLSGIWQPVWLESRAATYIRRVKISTNGEQVSVDVSMRGDLAEGLSAEIVAPNGEVAAHVQTDAPRFSIRIARPLPWSPDEPNLYTLKLNLTGFNTVDEVTETFGFRTIETRDGKILLNGRPFYLRGALDQDYYPDLICTPPSQEYIEAQFHKAKDMGLQCLRVHIKVADPRYYAAADKVGLLIWTELPNHNVLSDEAKHRARATLTGIMERDWNHPSIVIWTIINESWGIDLMDDAQRSWLVKTYDWMKKLDPTRLVVDNSACWGNFHVATDVADFHNYYAMPDHYRQWQEWIENYAHRPWWLFAHRYQDHAAWREFQRDPWHAQERPIAEDARRRGDEPLLVSEFGNWGLPDVHKLYEGNTGTAPWWFDTGLEWADAVVYPRHVEERFKDYHLDRIFPSLSALAEASQRLQYEALKYEIEQIRRYESIQGYVITEFTDAHWESNGLLDMYRNPKVYHDWMKNLNADDLLIPLWQRLVFTVDDVCTIKVLFSHYSPTEIKEALLRWEVVSDELPVVHGQIPVSQPSPFRVTELAVIRFATPSVDTPTRARLEFRLFNGENLIAASQQEIYIFPQMSSHTNLPRIYSPELQSTLERLKYGIVDEMSKADIVVTRTLDDTGREFLLRGGRVLFLAEADDALQTYIPGIEIGSRKGTSWQGDWASSFSWHAFDSLPTEHLVNFAFADLTPDHVIHGFAPRDFAVNVFAGLFVGWLHKSVPTIVRKRLGQGQLLISTFQLTKHLEANTLANYLFCELLELIA